MSILNILLLVIGLITVLIAIVGYKRRTLIIEMIRDKQSHRIALKELEDGLYKEAYLQALEEEVPKAMKAKAIRNIQKKYNKTPLMEKFAKMAESAQKEAFKRQRDPNHKTGFESIMDDMSVFNNKPSNTRSKKNKKNSKTMWDF